MVALPMAPTRTAFCSAVIDLDHILPGARFWCDGNSKITRENGTYAEPAPNAFSLPAASVEGQGFGSCPGSTEVCRSSCYVRNLAQHAPELYAHYTENADTLVALLAHPDAAFYAASALAVWIRAHASGGFRWHVSGDVWGMLHAQWIVSVCMLAPDVPFWIYTRTLGVVGALRAARNLAVNVSADRENYSDARRMAVATGATLTYLVGGDDAKQINHAPPGEGCRNCTGVPYDLPPGSVIFPDYALRGRDLADPTSAPWWQALTHEQRRQVCPTDFYGQSEHHRCGPCRRCL
jgi:hypothetical protein